MTTENKSNDSTRKKDLKITDLSIDVYYQEKYSEMRRQRDYQLSTANWCTVILLAIIAGFVSLNKNYPQTTTQCGSCEILLLKILIVLFIIAIVVSGSVIVTYSANRYAHLRTWVSDNLEPTINGKEYEPEPVFVKIQNVIIIILVILGLLTSGIIIIL